MRGKFQKIVAALAAIFLLPYVIVTLGAGEAKEAYALQRASENYISIQTEDGICEIAFEDYVCGVAAREMEAGCGIETAKAHMVIARTNLRKFQEEYPGTLLSEKYLTLDEMSEQGILDRMLQASEETRNQVLSFKGELIRAPFHAVSGGRTRSARDAGLRKTYPWLTAADSRQDVESEKYLFVRLEDPEAVRQRIETEYPGALTEEPVIRQMEIVARDKGGYVRSIRAGNQEIAGEKFRDLLELPSSCFFLEEIEGKIRITTKGLGHGLGLSRYGAAQMEEAGADYTEILRHYFRKCEVSEM